MEYIERMDIEEGIEFLELADAKEKERYLWELYCAQYPVMISLPEESYMTFAEFARGAYPEYKIAPAQNGKSAEEMIEELDRINAAAGGV